LDAQSRTQPLKDGDIVRVYSIIPRFEETVTLRGHVSNPGRYPWKPGMRVRDLIPDAGALLTRRYWRERAAIVNGRSTEYRFVETICAISRTGWTHLGTTFFMMMEPTLRINRTGAQLLRSGRHRDNVIEAGEQKPADMQQRSQPSEDNSVGPSKARNVAEDVRRYSPEINWDYAIIQRVNPVDLSSKLIWMSRGKRS